MASFSAGTTFTDGVANDVTAAKLAALVNNATPTSGLIQDRTAETITATNDTLLFGDASDSNSLKRITVANFAETLPTAKITTGTISTATLGTTTGTVATFTTLTAGTTTSTAATIPTLTAGTTTGTAATFSGDLTIADKIVHSGDTNTTIRFPAADTVTVETSGTERLRIDSSGNVGIGETSPDTRLHVKDLGEIIRVETTSTIGNNYLSFYKTSGTVRQGYLGYGGVASDTLFIYNEQDAPTVFYTNNTERLRIDSSGDVLIGTNVNASTQGGKLQVITDSVIRRNAASTAGAALRIEKSRSATDGGYTIVQDGDTIGDIQFFGSDGVDFAWAAAVRGIVDGAPGSNDMPGALLFLTSADGSQAPSERLRIDSDGNVSIGTATALSKLHVHGNITLSNTTTATSAGTSTITPPATVAGYLTVSINGTSRKIPYYAT